MQELRASFGKALFQSGFILEKAGAYRSAAVAYRHATRLYPSHPRWFARLGHARRKAGLWADAVEAFTIAVDRSPENADWNHWLEFVQKKAQHHRSRSRASSSTSSVLGKSAKEIATHIRTLCDARSFRQLRDLQRLLPENRLDAEARFLCLYGDLLLYKKMSAFIDGASAAQSILREQDHNLQQIAQQFGEEACTRLMADAAVCLTRIGRYPEARALLDEALARGAGEILLLQTRAEVCWPHDQECSLEDLQQLQRLGRASRGDRLLHGYLLVLGASPQQSEAALSEITEHLADRADSFVLRAVQAAGNKEFLAYRRSINRYFLEQGLLPVLPEVDEPFCFEALLSEQSDSKPDGPLVSVIMTTFNAVETLDYAVHSLLQQSHQQLELIIVDDCSTDGTREALHRMEQVDERIRLLFSDQNRGTYCAKNRAIEVAQGKYVTFHDSDDWAHPQHVQIHVDYMERNRKVAASRSEWLRITEEGEILFRRWGKKFQHPNPASLFLRRDVVPEVGYFDSVRFGADSEYWFRLQARYGKNAVAGIGKCLAFGRSHGASLTQAGAGAMDLENFSPIRAAYHKSYVDWHSQNPPENLFVGSRPPKRKFVAPPEMLPHAAVSDAMPTLQVQEPAPNFLFAISLAAQCATADWGRAEELLSHTLQSVLQQSDPRFDVVVCGHEKPDIPELEDPRVTFLVSDAAPPTDPSRYRRDKMRKRRIIGGRLRELGGGYFFPLDADDLVSRELVAYVLRDDNRRGYLIDRGYALDFLNGRAAPIPGAWSTSFDRVCGSSAAIYFDEEDLPRSGKQADSAVRYFDLFDSHAYWPIVAEELGRPFDRVPFPAAVYVVNHSQNLSFKLQRTAERQQNIIRSIEDHALDSGSAILASEFAWKARPQADRPLVQQV